MKKLKLQKIQNIEYGGVEIQVEVFEDNQKKNNLF